MKEKYLVLLPLEDADRATLAALTGGAEIIYSTAAEVTAEMLVGVTACLGNLPPRLLSAAPSLRWLGLSMAGADPYLKPGVLPDGVTLTNVTGAFGHAIGEHMVGCVFELFKKLHLYRDNQQRCEWLDRGQVRSVEGSVVLAVGMGDIGGDFARRMKALGAYTIGVRRSRVADKPDYADELHPIAELDALLPRADIVALSLPGTSETDGLMGRGRLALMKPDAILLNVGRGGAVDLEALCDALEAGRLGGAALDVTSPEPLPAAHRLWKLENAIITPHISGFFHLRETYLSIVRITLENARRHACGEAYLNVIDPCTGYVSGTRGCVGNGRSGRDDRDDRDDRGKLFLKKSFPLTPFKKLYYGG